MTPTSILIVVIIVFVTMIIAAMVLLRVRIGKPKSGSPASFATRRNSIIIVFVIFIFLMLWINRMVSGELAEQGVSGTTAMLVAVVGGASVNILLIDFIRKKRYS